MKPNTFRPVRADFRVTKEQLYRSMGLTPPTVTPVAVDSEPKVIVSAEAEQPQKGENDEPKLDVYVP